MNAPAVATTLAAALVATLLAAAGPASALSCMRPDPVRAFTAASEAEDSYIVVIGTFTFDEGKLPRGMVMDGSGDDPRPDPIPAQFKGSGLTLRGFTTPMDMPVTVQPVCFGPWCGGMASGFETLAFLRRDGTGYVVEADPCGGWVFPEPARAVRQQMVDCLRGEDCTPADPF